MSAESRIIHQGAFTMFVDGVGAMRMDGVYVGFEHRKSPEGYDVIDVKVVEDLAKPAHVSWAWTATTPKE